MSNKHLHIHHVALMVDASFYKNGNDLNDQLGLGGYAGDLTLHTDEGTLTRSFKGVTCDVVSPAATQMIGVGAGLTQINNYLQHQLKGYDCTIGSLTIHTNEQALLDNAARLSGVNVHYEHPEDQQAAQHNRHHRDTNPKHFEYDTNKINEALSKLPVSGDITINHVRANIVGHTGSELEQRHNEVRRDASEAMDSLVDAMFSPDNRYGKHYAVVLDPAPSKSDSLKLEALAYKLASEGKIARITSTGAPITPAHPYIQGISRSSDEKKQPLHRRFQIADSAAKGCKGNDRSLLRRHMGLHEIKSNNWNFNDRATKEANVATALLFGQRTMHRYNYTRLSAREENPSLFVLNLSNAAVDSSKAIPDNKVSWVDRFADLCQFPIIKGLDNALVRNNVPASDLEMKATLHQAQGIMLSVLSDPELNKLSAFQLSKKVVGALSDEGIKTTTKFRKDVQASFQTKDPGQRQGKVLEQLETHLNDVASAPEPVRSNGDVPVPNAPSRRRA